MMKTATLVFLIATCRLVAALTISGPVSLSGNWQAGGDALTVPSRVTDISPADGATHVNYLPTISWENGGGALTYQAYFDTSNPPTTSVQNSSATSYSPSALSFNTTYYLKINPSNNSGTTTGIVTSFTTEPAYAVDGIESFDVGGSDGDTLTDAAMNAATGRVSLGTWAQDSVVMTGIKNGGLYKIKTLGTTSSATWISLGATGPTPAVGDTFTAIRDGTALDGSGTTIVPWQFVSNTVFNLYSPFTHSGTVYEGNSATTGIKFGLHTQNNTMTLALTSPVSAMTLGFWIKWGDMPVSNPEGLDFVQIRHTGGSYVVLNYTVSEGKVHWECGINGVPFLGSTKIAVTNNTLYWVTMQCAVSGAGGATQILKIYASDGTTLLGTSTFDVSGGTAGNYNGIEIGRLDAHNASNQPSTSSYVWFSQMGISTTALTYPIGP